MDDLIDPAEIDSLLAQGRAWLDREVIDPGALVQAGAIVASLLIALLLAPPFTRWLQRRLDDSRDDARLAFVWRTFLPLVTPIIWVVLLWIAIDVAARLGWPVKLMSIVTSLLNAWIVIRLVTQFVRDPVWSRFIAVVVWAAAALNILGLLSPALEMLDGIAFSIGEVRITALGVVEGLFYLVVLLWLANLFSQLFERRIRHIPNLTPSVQVLFAKLLKIALITLAILVAVTSVGIDLTALAVFGGALGVGIGFGLQKIVANFVSGIILLMDRSIKPGDTIGIEQTYGWIQKLGARYVSVVTRDGVEHLIPNEDLITNRVENWSYSDDNVRFKVPVGISYRADVRKAMAQCIEAAQAVARVLDSPKPICLLKGFGDSSVDLEVRFWINDPRNGVSNVKSEVLLGIWDRFHEHGIEIPFPQRDLHLKSVAPDAAGLIRPETA